MQFEWDEVKAAENERKHGVIFAEIGPAFADAFAIEVPDIDDEQQEERWNLIASQRGTILFIVYTLRGPNVRLISARKAETHERERYWKNRVL